MNELKRSLYSVILLLLMGSIILTACGQKDVTEISLAEVTRSVFYTPQYVAIEQGFFEEEGLEVDLQTTWGGDKTMTALLSDHADIALVGSETSIYVYGQEASDLVINFAQLTQTDGTFLVSKNPHDDFTWEDIKGKQFLGQREGGMPQMVGEYVIKENGMDPHLDLELDQHIDFANIPGAFASGDYEYVQLFEPTASMLEAEGEGHVIASFGEESGTIPYTVYMAKESYLEDNKDIVSRFTKAIYEAQQWVEDASSEEIAEVVQPYFEDTSLEMLATSIERYKEQGSFATDPLLTEDAWNNLQAIMKEAGELPKDAPYEELVNTDIVKEITKN